MAKRILDTEVLISHYRNMAPRSVDEARNRAMNLINIQGTNSILWPIRVEFLCGIRDSDELKLYSAYLEPFEILDKPDVKQQDWSEAEREAQRFKEGERRRKLGDCLIKAIAKRLNVDVVTRDPDFRLRTPPK